MDNVNGKIRIVTWEQPEIKVDAIKRGTTENDLDEVKIEIETKPDYIRIHTASPRNRWKLWGRGNSTSVEYDIQVPANVRLGKVENVNGSLSVAGVRGRIHASSVNGQLTAEGVEANVDLESVNGRVRVSFDNLQAVTHATVKTVNGGVAVILPTDASAEVSAHTLNGSINSGHGLAPKKHWPIGSDLHGTLGKGGTQLNAETVNGSIQIRVGENYRQKLRTLWP